MVLWRLPISLSRGHARNREIANSSFDCVETVIAARQGEQARLAYIRAWQRRLGGYLFRELDQTSFPQTFEGCSGATDHRHCEMYISLSFTEWPMTKTTISTSVKRQHVELRPTRLTAYQLRRRMVIRIELTQSITLSIVIPEFRWFFHVSLPRMTGTSTLLGLIDSKRNQRSSN